MDPIFSLTLKKPKENQGFQLQPLNILKKVNDFHLKSSKLAIGGQDKADRAEARHSKRASRAKAEHSRRGGRAKPGNTLCKNNNTAAFGGCAAASPPQLLCLVLTYS